MVGPENPVALREQHAGAGIEGVIDSPRALHDETLRVGVTPRVHVGIAHLAPEMRRALFHRAHEFGNAQRVGQPFQFDAVFLFQLEQPLVGDEGVGNCNRCKRACAAWSSLIPERLQYGRAKRMGPGAFKHRGARMSSF